MARKRREAPLNDLPVQKGVLPSREELRRFIRDSPGRMGKREIIGHFGLRFSERYFCRAQRGFALAEPSGCFLTGNFGRFKLGSEACFFGIQRGDGAVRIGN